MNAFDKSSGPTLHVFEQDGFWQWGITCDRPGGTGAKVIAYSDPGFFQHKKLAPTANECARGLAIASNANVLEGEGHAYRREAPGRIGRQVARV
jgi:hypothetical protein